MACVSLTVLCRGFSFSDVCSFMDYAFDIIAEKLCQPILTKEADLIEKKLVVNSG